MKIVGYSDRFSVRPRQRIRFMVSSKLPTYEAEIVRLSNGDPNPMGSAWSMSPWKPLSADDTRDERRSSIVARLWLCPKPRHWTIQRGSLSRLGFSL